MKKHHLPLIITLALSACTAGTNYARPELPSAPALQSGSFLRAAQANATAPAARWWDALGDAQLSALIDKGLNSAPRIAVMQARVRQARASLEGARADRRPEVDASTLQVNAALPRGRNASLYGAGFEASWELDLWGGKRRAVERSQADAQEAEAWLADAQVTLSAEIARTYIDLRACETRLALLTRRQTLETSGVIAAQRRLKGGTGTRLPIIQAQQRFRLTEADVARMNADIVILRDTLAVLTGGFPGSLDSLATAPIPLPPTQVTIGDPAGLLARRPDVRAAERRLAATTAHIGVVDARRFPNISLSGLIGLGGSNPGEIFNPSNLAAIAMPRLSWSFLDFGRNAAAKRGAEAGRDEALAEYQQSIADALLDAESALARFGASRISFAEASGQLAEYERIARLQRVRAQGGTIAAADVIEADRQTIDARLSEANSRAEITIAYVRLAKALGLGWQA